jgi:hypothetical protein
VVVDVRFFGVIALFVLSAVVVAVGQRSVIVDVRVPGGSMLEGVTEALSVMVADMPVVMAMLGRRVGVLRLLALAFGPLSDIRHRGVSFRVGVALEILHSVCQATSVRRQLDGTSPATNECEDDQGRDQVLTRRGHLEAGYDTRNGRPEPPQCRVHHRVER